MSLLKRILSPRYRQAIAAEASGNYVEAARAYALCGMRDKVAEMHLLEAERSTTEEERLDELRAAVHFADDDTEAGRRLLRRISRSYLNVLRKGTGTSLYRKLGREAARLALRGGDPMVAAEAYELLGDEMEAAEAYQAAGEVERMEALLAREERRRRGQSEERDSFEAYQMNLRLGRRDAALLALQACARARSQEDEPQRLLEDMSKRMLVGGKIALRRQGPAPEGPGPTPTLAGDMATLYAGSFPLTIGRDPQCHLSLRDGGISRVHASIQFLPAAARAPATFTVQDLQSRNGTTLDGMPMVGELPLRGEGEIGIGDKCTLSYRVEGTQLSLGVLRGVDRGLRLVASPGPIGLWPVRTGDVGTGLSTEMPGDLPAAMAKEMIELYFEEGRPYVRLVPPPASDGEAPGTAGAPRNGGGAVSGLMLNGQRVGQAVQLIAGDVVSTGGTSFTVLP